MAQLFVILDPDPIVRLDLEGTITALHPHASVVVSADVADIGTVLDQCGEGSLIFVRANLLDDDDELARTLRRAATRACDIVLIGSVIAVDFPVRYIDVPFSTEMVQVVLEKPAH